MFQSVFARMLQFATNFRSRRSEAPSLRGRARIGYRPAGRRGAVYSALSLVRLACALVLLSALPGAVGGTSARADLAMTAYIVGDGYVGYNADNVPSSNGTLVDIGYVDPAEGHVVDMYGNVLTINADASISDSANNPVGFVCVASSTAVVSP